jgi:hypothetical protein
LLLRVRRQWRDEQAPPRNDQSQVSQCNLDKAGQIGSV